MVTAAAPAAPPPAKPAPRRMPAADAAQPEVPAWVNRWKAKLPEKLRSTVQDFATSGPANMDISEKQTPPTSPAKKAASPSARAKAPIPSPAPANAPVPSPSLASSNANHNYASASSCSGSMGASASSGSIPGLPLHQENLNPQATKAGGLRRGPSIFANRPRPEDDGSDAATEAAASSASLLGAGARAAAGAEENVTGWSSSSLLETELEIERRRRKDAEEGRREAMERAAVLNMQVDGLRGEIERLQMILKRVDVSAAETADEAREMAEMFTRLAAEAERVAAEKQAEYEKECMTPGGTMVEDVPSPGVRRQKEAEELAAKEEYDPEYAEVQINFMSLQYDEIFSMLEKREGDATLALYRASWLRKMHAEEEDLDELLPKTRPHELPPEARISARELRKVFAQAYGGGGYRKVDLPFITVTQFWVCREHPDPEDECLQGVIAYLQARWEEFTDRDVAIYIDLGKPTDPKVVEELEAVEDADATEAVLWLVTSRARTRMAAAHHEAFMQQLERSTAASPRAAGQTPGQTPDARAASQSDAAAATPLRAGASSAAPAQEAAGGGLKRSSAEQSLHPEGAPGAAEAEAAGGGWSSARSQGSSSAGRAPSTSSNGMGSEDVL